MEIGEKIRAVRGGLTRNQFLSKLNSDMGQHSLYKIEAGLRNPSVDFVRIICGHYKLTMGHFYDDQVKTVTIQGDNPNEPEMAEIYKLIKDSEISPRKWKRIIRSVLESEDENQD